MPHPFWETAEETLRGERVTVTTTEGEYSGIVSTFHFQDHAVMLEAVEQPDGTRTGTALIEEPVALTLDTDETELRVTELPLDAIRPHPANVREYDGVGFAAFVRQVRENGHISSIPLVRPVPDERHASSTEEERRDSASDEDQQESTQTYEIVSGHRRTTAIRRAGLDTHRFRVRPLTDWEATVQFLDEHVPVTWTELNECTHEESEWYTPPQIRECYQRLSETVERERLWSHPGVQTTAAICEADAGEADRVFEILTGGTKEMETGTGDSSSPDGDTDEHEAASGASGGETEERGVASGGETEERGVASEAERDEHESESGTDGETESDTTTVAVADVTFVNVSDSESVPFDVASLASEECSPREIAAEYRALASSGVPPAAAEASLRVKHLDELVSQPNIGD